MNKTNMLQQLEWDSNFFGKKIAKIDSLELIKNAAQINRQIKESSFDLVYCFARQNEGNVEEIVNVIDNAVWVDGKVTYLKEVQKQVNIDLTFIGSANEMENGLFDLAIQTGIYSRFHTDKRFEPDQYINLYKKWIENSVNRSIADEVGVWRENELLEGMITIGEKSGRADIGLVGVDQSARGKGIATQLLRFAENFAYNKGFKELQVVTQQQNEPACRLYEKYGFELESVVNIFHIWK
ncbi:MAG: GNAT family N-acetyltransferase [Bacteroidota bacterium]